MDGRHVYQARRGGGRVNQLGYTRDFALQCSAWTINNQGPARKQCGLPVAKDIAGWIYLCRRHYELVESEIEREIDTLNSRRVESLQEQLAGKRVTLAELLSDVEFEAAEREYVRARAAQTVYFIRCQQYVKIGISQNPAVRLQQIRKGGGSHFPRLMDVETSEIVTTEPGGLTREKELHARFSHLRHTGEWFTEAPELTDYINSLSEAAA